MRGSDYFLYVGNAYPHKNLDIVIKVANRLKVNFYIVSKESVFTKKIKESEYVKLLGFVEDKKLQELYENSVGFIYPSLVEGFGLQGLEAMKNGTILLCSDIPVFHEIYSDHAIYFNPKDESSIENAINKVLGMNKKDRAKKIKEAREFIKRYSWEKMAKETLEVYKSLG